MSGWNPPYCDVMVVGHDQWTVLGQKYRVPVKIQLRESSDSWVVETSYLNLVKMGNNQTKKIDWYHDQQLAVRVVVERRPVVVRTF